MLLSLSLRLALATRHSRLWIEVSHPLRAETTHPDPRSHVTRLSTSTRSHRRQHIHSNSLWDTPFLPAAEPLASTCAISTRHTNATNALLTLRLGPLFSLLRAPPGVLITQHTHEVVHTHTHTLGSARDRSKEKLQVVLKSHTPHDPPPPPTHFACKGEGGKSPSTASHLFKREGACRAASRRPGSPHRARRGRRSTRGGGGRPSSRPRAFQCWGGGGWRRRAGC